MAASETTVGAKADAAEVTVTRTTDDALPAKVELALYMAVMLCVPTARAAVL